MPPMSRPLMTAWATVSHMRSTGSGFHHRRARVRLGEDAGEIAVLPLNANGVAIDVLAVGSELDLAARCHRRIAGGYVERRQSLANFLRIGRARSFQRIGEHERL